MIKRTSSVEVGLFKLALSEPHHSGRDLDIRAVGSSSIGDDATRAVGALSRIIDMGYYGTVVHPGTELSDVIKDATAFRNKPMIARDLLIARFLASHNNAKHPSMLLDGRLDAAVEHLFVVNLEFAKQLATPLRCVRAAAELTRDYRLVMLDVHPLIRWLMMLSISPDHNLTMNKGSQPPGVGTASWSGPLLKTAKDTYTNFVDKYETGGTEVDMECGVLVTPEAFDNISDLANRLRPLVEQDYPSPYPTMATAWVLGGVGGTEAAISLLTRWIAKNPPPLASDADKSGEAWLYARTVMELDLFIPDDMIDAGDKTLDEYYDKMFESILIYLPMKFDWYDNAICSFRADADIGKDSLFYQTQQSFYQSIAGTRLRAYRSKIALNKPTNRVVTDDMIEEAKKLAKTRRDCFPLVPRYEANRDLFLGQAAAYVGHLQKAYVDVRLGDSLTGDQKGRLREARSYFHQAQDLLEYYQQRQDSTRGTSELADDQPEQDKEGKILHEFAVSAAEQGVLSGAGPAGQELARIRRALIAIDQIVEQE